MEVIAAKSEASSTIARATRNGPPDGSAVYFTVQERGSVHLVRLPIAGGQREYVVNDVGTVGGWSVGKDGSLAYSFTTPRDAAELYYKPANGAARKLTDLNAELFLGKQIADVESFTFVSNELTPSIPMRSRSSTKRWNLASSYTRAT